MRNKRAEQKIKEEIIALREKELYIQGELKQKMFDLYVAMGISVDRASRMV